MKVLEWWAQTLGSRPSPVSGFSLQLEASIIRPCNKSGVATNPILNI